MEVDGEGLERHAVQAAVRRSRHHAVRRDEAPQPRVIVAGMLLQQARPVQPLVAACLQRRVTRRHSARQQRQLVPGHTARLSARPLPAQIALAAGVTAGAPIRWAARSFFHLDARAQPPWIQASHLAPMRRQQSRAHRLRLPELSSVLQYSHFYKSEMSSGNVPALLSAVHIFLPLQQLHNEERGRLAAMKVTATTATMCQRLFPQYPEYTFAQHILQEGLLRMPPSQTTLERFQRMRCSF